MNSLPPAEVVVLGGANYDYLARAERLPGAGETVSGDTVHDGTGGKGANQAVAAARLGARVTFIGCVGADERGALAMAALEREGIRTEGVVRTADAPTGVALIHVNATGQKQILAVPGANLHLQPAHVEAFAHLLRGAKAVLLQLEVPLETTLAAARLAHTAGIPVLLDPAPACPLPDELFPLLAIIKPNAAEAEALTGYAVYDQRSARAAGQVLLHRGARAVVITAGREGSLLLTAKEEHFFPRREVASIDATGAGDAFAGALGVFLAEGHPLPEAVRRASAAAALSTTRIGAQESLPTRTELERFLQAP